MHPSFSFNFITIIMSNAKVQLMNFSNKQVRRFKPPVSCTIFGSFEHLRGSSDQPSPVYFEPFTSCAIHFVACVSMHSKFNPSFMLNCPMNIPPQPTFNWAYFFHFQPLQGPSFYCLDLHPSISTSTSKQPLYELFGPTSSP